MQMQTIHLSEVITDIAAGPFGSNLKVSCFVDDGFPIIDGANLKGMKVTDNITKYVTEEKARSLHRSIAKRNDVVVTISGTLGQIAYIPFDSKYEEYLCSQRQFRVSFDTTKVYVPYLVFYFHTYEGQNKILSFANQVGVPALSQPLKNFRQIEISIPMLEEQKKIASIIESINGKIERNTAINDNLEQQAKALYKDWFLDFSPFSSDGTLPEGWRIGTVGDIIQLHDSKRVPLSGTERGKMAKLYPYYGATSLMDYVDNYLFDGIYLLLGEDGTVVDNLGFPILQYVYGRFWVNNHAHIITGKEGFSVEELYLFFGLTNIKSIVTGAVQQKVSQQNLKKVPAIIPSNTALSSFDELIQPIFSQIRNLRDENARLTSLRDALLPKLMSGELDVSAVEL